MTPADGASDLSSGTDVTDADLRHAIESITDYAIFLLDQDGIVRSWSPGAQRIKGWAADEVIGQHFSIFYRPEDIAGRKPWRELEVALADGHLEDEGWRVRRDGSTFWASVVITAVRGPDGRQLGFAKITRDLTKRKQAEQAARKMALLEQHEAIGTEILSKTVASLFGIGLSLQAVLMEVDDKRVQAQLEDAINELDRVISDVRRALYGRMSTLQQADAS